jgi:hypothetical protein
MAELKITPIVPHDEDDEPAARKKRAAAPRKPRDPAAARTASIEGTELADPEKPEFDERAVSDEVKRRYGLDQVKVTEVKRSRSGVKSHKTGATRR